MRRETKNELILEIGLWPYAAACRKWQNFFFHRIMYFSTSIMVKGK